MLSFFKKKDRKPTIWVVSDGTDAVVQANELAKRITDGKNIIQFDRLLAHSQSKKYPDYAIGARLGVAETLIGIKERSAGKTKIIQILDPQKKHDKFDWLILPSYEPYNIQGNVIKTTGLINYINDEVLKKAENDYKISKAFEYLRHKNLKPPFIAVILGGKHVGGNLTEEDGKFIAEKLNFSIEQKGGTALISTSRRTEFSVIKGFRDNLKSPHFIYDYKVREVENPYEIFLYLAEEIIVTADSVRMMSEACSTGKKVRIYSPKQVGFQYIPLMQELVKNNYAVDFDSIEIQQSVKKLDEASRVAKLIFQPEV
jgi:hypothetical protein